MRYEPVAFSDHAFAGLGWAGAYRRCPGAQIKASCDCPCNSKCLVATRCDPLPTRRDLQAVLRLLHHVTQRDLADACNTSLGGNYTPAVLEGTSPESPPDAGAMALLGLNIVIPLISAELLKYPKLCGRYFDLLAALLEG